MKIEEKEEKSTVFVTTFATVEDETGTVIKSKSKKVVEEKGVIVEEQLSDDDFHSAEEDNGHVQIEEVADDEFVIGKSFGGLNSVTEFMISCLLFTYTV